jgi:hypothetical protein
VSEITVLTEITHRRGRRAARRGLLAPNGGACSVALWDDVFDVYAIGEFDQTHLILLAFARLRAAGIMLSSRA